jgi:hypothetical protein
MKKLVRSRTSTVRNTPAVGRLSTAKMKSGKAGNRSVR